MLKFLIVEDDFMQGDATSEALQDDFPSAQIETLTTEREFYDAIDSLLSNPPAVIIMDIKLPWDDPSEGRRPAPTKVLEEGDGRAGIRCWEQICSRSRNSKIKVLFYSHILDDELEHEIQESFPGAHSLRKSESSISRSSYDRLIEKIREILAIRASHGSPLSRVANPDNLTENPDSRT